MVYFVVECPISGYSHFGRQVFGVRADDDEAAARKLLRHLRKDRSYSAYLGAHGVVGYGEEDFIDEVLSEGGLRHDTGFSVSFISPDDFVVL